MRTALLVVVAAGCQFSSSLTSTDAGAPVTVGFERATSIEDEASGTVMLPVTLSAPSGSPVTVSYEVADGSATQGLDYDATNGTLQFAPGETTKHVAITIRDDGNEEGDETLSVHLSGVIGAELGTANHTMTINSNILSRVFFTLLQSTGAESETTVQLNIALDVASASEVKVDYTLGGDATAADYNLAVGTVVFPPGTLSRTIDLAPIDDLLDEDPEDVIVTLVNPVDVIVKPAEGVRRHTLTDNDPEPEVRFTQTTTTTAETGTVMLTVSLSAVSGRKVKVSFSAMPPGSNAASAADYTYGVSSPLEIPAGTQQVMIPVTIVADTMDEFDESFATVLASPVNATLGTSSHAIAITDDDLEPTVSFDATEADGTSSEAGGEVTYKLRLSAASGKPISVPIQFAGSASDSDYDHDAPVDFAPGEIQQTLTLDIIDDISVGEPNETIIMDIANNGQLVNVRQGSPSRRTHTIVDDDLL